MATIQWRPEVNALTTPQSYRLLFMPLITTVADSLLELKDVLNPAAALREIDALDTVAAPTVRISMINREQLSRIDSCLQNSS